MYVDVDIGLAADIRAFYTKSCLMFIGALQVATLVVILSHFTQKETKFRGQRPCHKSVSK